MTTKMLTMLGGTAVCLVMAIASHAQADPVKYRPQVGTIVPFTAAHGSSRVEALINGDGSIARSKGILSVTHFGTGEYCVTLNSSINANTGVPVLTFNYNSSPDFDVFIAYSPSLGSECAANSIGVVTYNADAGGHTFADEGFTIILP